MLELPVTVGDLRDDEVPGLGWAGRPGYCESVAGELLDRNAGLLDHLAARGPAGLPIAIGGIRFDRRRDSGTIHQLSVMPHLRSCGVGTMLIGALETELGVAVRAMSTSGSRTATRGPVPSTSGSATSRSPAAPTRGPTATTTARQPSRWTVGWSGSSG